MNSGKGIVVGCIQVGFSRDCLYSGVIEGHMQNVRIKNINHIT